MRVRRRRPPESLERARDWEGACHVAAGAGARGGCVRPRCRHVLAVR